MVELVLRLDQLFLKRHHELQNELNVRKELNEP